MRRWVSLTCLGWIALILVACNLPDSTTPTVGGIDSIRTSAARTLDANSTLMAITPNITLSKTMPIPSGQPPEPSSTPQVQLTKTTPTLAPACDQATFVRDVSIPDGTFLQPGASFTKVWELKNTGSCPWNSTYSLVFANEGDLMGAQISNPLIRSGAVQPGELVQVVLDLKAPASPGDYKSHWRLRSPAGVDFGPAGKTIWLTIKVKLADKNFIMDNLCNAEWRNGSGVDLPCPTNKSGSPKGAMFRVENPKFSTGYQDNEPAFQLEPEQINNGLIVGKFPPYQVNATETQFRTIFGCAYNEKSCDAKVTITAQVGSDPEQTLGEWNVTYLSDWVVVRADLAARGMAGQSVVLRFYVRTNGAPTQDRILFLSPIFAKP
jgi:hypothetical protein